MCNFLKITELRNKREVSAWPRGSESGLLCWRRPWSHHRWLVAEPVSHTLAHAPSVGHLAALGSQKAATRVKLLLLSGYLCLPLGGDIWLQIWAFNSLRTLTMEASLDVRCGGSLRLEPWGFVCVRCFWWWWWWWFLVAPGIEPRGALPLSNSPSSF